MSTVVVNCECGSSCEHSWNAFQTYLFFNMVECLACDICGGVPNVNYGGMSV